MERLPDFEPTLDPLLKPESVSSTNLEYGKSLSRPQKRIIGVTLAGLLLLISLLIFGCLFVIRLWPVVFPNAVSLPIPTVVILPSSTSTTLPTFTPTIIIPTQTSTSVPTSTYTAQPPLSTPFLVGVLTGNLNVRTEPSIESPSLGVILAGEKVIIQDQQGIWYLITWPVEGEPTWVGWINGESFVDLPKDDVP